jgi:hypothetical protein
VSLGPLAVVLLVPVALVVGLRTDRWKRVIVVGGAAAITAVLLPTAAMVIVAGAMVSLIAGAVVLGTGAHRVGRPTGSLSVAELMAGGLALRWLRRRQVRRWTDSWARLVRPPKL